MIENPVEIGQNRTQNRTIQYNTAQYNATTTQHNTTQRNHNTTRQNIQIKRKALAYNLGYVT